MPGRNVHVPVGAVVGCCVSFVASEGQRNNNRMIEAVGGAIGGAIGGRLPDVIEPATWPGHREFFHSYSFGAGIAIVSCAGMKDVQGFMRDCAIKCETLARRSDNPWGKFFLGVSEIACRVAAGFVPGLVAGYISHLVLDSSTPKSLPLI